MHLPCFIFHSQQIRALYPNKYVQVCSCSQLPWFLCLRSLRQGCSDYLLEEGWCDIICLVSIAFSHRTIALRSFTHSSTCPRPSSCQLWWTSLTTATSTKGIVFVGVHVCACVSIRVCMYLHSGLRMDLTRTKE